MTQVFDEQYYRSNNYADYLSKRERYVKTAEEIQQVFHKFSVIDQNSAILDYGCSLGFLLKGFEKAGFKNISGYPAIGYGCICSEQLSVHAKIGLPVQ